MLYKHVRCAPVLRMKSGWWPGKNHNKSMKFLNGVLGQGISVLSYSFAPKAFKIKISCLSNLYLLFISKVIFHRAIKRQHLLYQAPFQLTENVLYLYLSSILITTVFVFMSHPFLSHIIPINMIKGHTIYVI